jgi:hypothetical protein
LTFATGHPRYATMAKALALSLELNFCDVPKVVVTDSDDMELRRLFDVVLAPPKGFDHWFIKLCGLECTGFDSILFIDGDSLAVGPIGPLLERLKGSDFAVQGTWLSDCEWYGDMTATMRRRGIAAVPKFSGGFLYYERTDKAREVISRTMSLAADYDALGLERNRGKVVDEVCIAIAMAESGHGKAFPDSAQLSRTPYGLQTRVHLDVLRGECSFVKGGDPPRLVKPTIYHSGHAAWDLAYWREVRRLMMVGAKRLGRTSEDRDLAVRGRHWKRALTSILHGRSDRY